MNFVCRLLTAFAGLVSLAAVMVLPTVPAHAEKRVALVIGNGAYAFAGRLTNPANDATDMAKALREIGFDVVDGIDLDRRAMDTRIREFSRKLGEASIALFFYAGHGMQVGGKNYLIPIDAKLEQPGDLALDTVEVGVVLQQMEARERVNLIFLDACRDNPLSRSFARSLGASRSASIGPGLASIQSAVGTMIAFATQPDAVARDGTGRNSPFTAALLKRIRSPGVDITVMMRHVRNDVLAATGRQQVPWDHSSLTDAVVLVPGEGGQVAAAAPSIPVASPPATIARPSASPPAPPSVAEAAQAWTAAKDTKNATVLQSFIKRYDNTIYGDMARARLQELQAAGPKLPDKVAVAAPPGRPGATLQPAAPEQTIASPCSKLAGTWTFMNGIDVVFKSDGTGMGSNGVSGTYTCSGATFTVIWSHGFSNRLTLSGDGKRLTGVANFGDAVSATRQ